MALMPHDTAELALAPLVLNLEHEIGAFSGMRPEEVRRRIAIDTNSEPGTFHGRREALLRALTQTVDLHGWNAAINDRGLRVSHRKSAVTIGFPKSLRTYLDA